MVRAVLSILASGFDCPRFDSQHFQKFSLDICRGGGIVVIALAFYSYDPNLNPAGY